MIALNLASNFGRTIFGWVGPVLASKTSPAGPNYVDQTWSGRTDFSPDQFFRYRSRRFGKRLKRSVNFSTLRQLTDSQADS